MKVSKQDLEKMNGLLDKGTTIADIANKFPKYGYWDIYLQVCDFSLLGKKRSISNRLKKLRKKLSQGDRTTLVDEIAMLLKEIYSQSKANGKKLIDIERVLRR